MDILWLLFICIHCICCIFYSWLCNISKLIYDAILQWEFSLEPVFVKKLLPFSLRLHLSVKHQRASKLFTLFIVFQQMFVQSKWKLVGWNEIWIEGFFLTWRKLRLEWRSGEGGGIGGQNCGTKFLGFF